MTLSGITLTFYMFYTWRHLTNSDEKRKRCSLKYDGSTASAIMFIIFLKLLTCLSA